MGLEALTDKEFIRYAKYSVKEDRAEWTEKHDGEEFINATVESLCKLIEELIRRLEQNNY